MRNHAGRIVATLAGVRAHALECAKVPSFPHPSTGTSRSMPDLEHHPASFSAAVHGTVFAGRMAIVHRLQGGDELLLIPDPPGAEVPAVWVHARGGDVVGHLPVQIAAWLAPWMLAGGRARAYVERVGDDDVASWNRLIVTVRCFPDGV